MTGLHTGSIPMRIEHHADEPPVGAEWEEVVEVLFSADTDELNLQAFQWGDEITLPEEGTYRVRYCARGFQQARDQDTRLGADPVVDVYLVQLWPATAAPDEVVRVTSPHAQYWHSSARETPELETGAAPRAPENHDREVPPRRAPTSGTEGGSAGIGIVPEDGIV